MPDQGCAHIDAIATAKQPKHHPAGWRAGPRAPRSWLRSDGSREHVRLCPTADPACHEHDNQHQENEPSKTTPHCRAT